MDSKKIHIPVFVHNKVALAPPDARIVCGNGDYVIDFHFDEDWDGIEEKTALFTFKRNNCPDQETVKFSGSSVDVPVLHGIRQVNVGVYAGNLQTTTGAKIPCEPSILDTAPDDGEVPPTEAARLNARVDELEKKVGEIELTPGEDGKDGADGKSAYEYAKDGGYTGTEEDFAKKLAEEYPTKLSEFENDLYGGIRREEVVSLSKTDFTPFEEIGDAYIGTSVLGLPSDPAEIGYELNVSVQGQEFHQTEADVPVGFSEDEGFYFIPLFDSLTIVFMDGVNLEEAGVGTGTGCILISPVSLPSVADSFTLSLYRPVVAKKIPARFVDLSGAVFENFSGVGSFNMNGATGIVAGDFSHTEGKDAAAIGLASHAEGTGTTAEGAYSHAEGTGTNAKGQASHAEGTGTTAEEAYSHAEGSGTNAKGQASHAEGLNTTAKYQASHAEGRNTSAESVFSHAEGDGTTAKNHSAHAEGEGTTAEGAYSHAEGSGTNAKGQASHAEGYGTTAEGAYSHAEGSGANAKGQASHAEGYRTTAEGSHSHAEGSGTNAYGLNSHTEGGDTTAEGFYSHAEGYGTTATGKCQHVQGAFNEIDPDASSDNPGARGKYAHIVGNGLSNESRSNAHTLDWKGNAWFAGGVILTSPDGTRYKITVENGGALNVAETTD